MGVGKPNNLQNLVGVSVKHQHHHAIEAGGDLSPYFEVISENYMKTEGYPLHVVSQAAQASTFSMHGVSYSVGSVDLNRHDYLQELQKLIAALNPVVISDHLCWTGWGNHTTHDLLPLPLNSQSLAVVCDNVNRLQDCIGRQFTLENISRYVDFYDSNLKELDFLTETVEKTGCSLLLDVNNVFVNSVNFGFDAYDFIDQFPGSHVVEYHIAGHTDRGSYLYDTHVGPVPKPVIDLFSHTVRIIGRRPTILEWDTDVPTYEQLLEERERIERVANEASSDSRPDPESNYIWGSCGYSQGQESINSP